MNIYSFYYEVITPRLKKVYKILDIRKKKTSKTPLGKIESHTVSESRTFSQRIGMEEMEKEVQTHSMDKDLKNSLWNVIGENFFPNVSNLYTILIREDKEFFSFIEKLWLEFFKSPSDYILYGYVGNAINELRVSYMSLKWNEVYDLIEFIIENYDPMTSKSKSDFISSCNKILERESSYYRIINNKIVPKYYG